MKKRYCHRCRSWRPKKRARYGECENREVCKRRDSKAQRAFSRKLLGTNKLAGYDSDTDMRTLAIPDSPEHLRSSLRQPGLFAYLTRQWDGG
jgi:hypothetical protein